MKCYLFCNRQKPPDQNFPRNDGVEDVLRKPEAFRYQGYPLELVETAAMAQDERRRAYIVAAVNRDYDVKAVFGLGTSRGILFGTVVPALVVESEVGSRSRCLSPSKSRTRGHHPRSSDQILMSINAAKHHRLSLRFL
jgi:hypothetical protein